MPTNTGNWPILRKYNQDHLLHIALPLGGIGTGTVSLGGRGDLRDWEIVNRPAKGFVPKQSFFALYAKPSGGEAVTRALEGPIAPVLYQHGFGGPSANHGLPRFRKCSFETAYPFGRVLLSDSAVPVDVRIEAFNPLIPGDADASGIPVAVLRFVLRNKTGKAVTASVCGSIENFIGRDGKAGASSKNVNEFRKSPDGKLASVLLRSDGVDKQAEQWGTMALSTATTSGITYRTAWANLSWGDSLLDFWDDFSADGRLEDRDAGGVDAPQASLAATVKLPPKGERAVTFLLTWHFPNRQTWSPLKKEEAQAPAAASTAGAACCPGGACRSPDCIGNYYTTRYADAWDVAVRTAADLPRLEKETARFVQAFCDSDYPEVLKEAALFNLPALRSQTAFRTEDGRFYGWEGCGDHDGCCNGTCTHVWNYEQATAFLFGDLSRMMREVEFTHATRDNGHMSFRVNLPLGRESWFLAAADGQMGCLVKLYRDWQLSGDEPLLRTLWPKARKAIEFCWVPGGWDADRDGVMEGCQHNTMDVEYFGPNPQINVIYLAALRAGEEMARYVGETAFADTCREVFQRGSRWMDQNLFNGEYYEQHVQPVTDPAAIAPGLRHEHMGARNLTDPELQVGPGCEVNQLFGQQLARVAGLGALLDEQNIRTALRSLVRYNFRTSLADHFNHLRSYALGEEGGLLLCTWPRGGRPKRPFPYAKEVWTGLEYMVAAHLIAEGLTADGLKVIAAARARHDGLKRSPFNEPECGHHYARAMSSWATVVAYSGFAWSAVDQSIQFGPPAGRRATTWFWSNGSAWGTVTQKSKGKTAVEVELTVLRGTLPLRKLSIVGIGSVQLDAARTVSPGKALKRTVTRPA